MRLPELTDSITKTALVTWHWYAVLIALLYTLGFGWRWIQTHQISDGHALIGLAGVVCSLFELLIVAFALPWAGLFAPFAITPTVVWLFYNDWYFNNYPTYAAWLTNPNREPDTFGMETALAKLLMKRSSVVTQWKPVHLKTAAWIATGVFLLTWGFVERINGIAEGQRREEAIRKEAVGTVRKAVETAVQSTTAAVAVAVDTITRGQAVVLAVVDSNHRKDEQGRARIANVLQATTNAQNSKLNRLGQSVERTRRSFVTPTTLAPAKPSGFSLPATVRPVNPVRVDKHGKPISENEFPIEQETGSVTVRKNNDYRD